MMSYIQANSCKVTLLSVIFKVDHREFERVGCIFPPMLLVKLISSVLFLRNP